MNFIQVPAFAKVNLRLDVLGRRSDGYHELRTIFQALTLHDTVRLEHTAGNKIELKILGNADLAGGPARQNLVWRALAALRRELKAPGGLRVELHKRIPVGRGLGGGSSDAAAAMVALLRLTRRQLPLKRVLELASELGADVPFFLLGGRGAGTRRGGGV